VAPGSVAHEGPRFQLLSLLSYVVEALHFQVFGRRWPMTLYTADLQQSRPPCIFLIVPAYIAILAEWRTIWIPRESSMP
jgi:hypothetical protein